MSKIVIIDNFDSFTYNIVEYYRSQGHEVQVFRNNAISVSEVLEQEADLIILSPGPKSPEFAGISIALITACAGKVPLFGVCLGCQAIAQAFGASIIRAQKMYHGKTSSMIHEGKGVLQGVFSPMTQMRYHSLIIDESTLPADLEVTARSDSGEIMAMRHKTLGIEGVQFHPESIASMQGDIIMDNALLITCQDKKDVSPIQNISSDETYVQEVQQRVSRSLISGNNLSKKDASELMRLISQGLLDPTVVAMVLTSLRMKGETSEEIAGIAEVAREFAIKLPIVHKALPHLVDIVGTGGDASNTFNISTAAAIVASGAGAQVAKHGNRAVSSSCGSADVLEQLGINIELSPEDNAKMLLESGMCFMFAPKYHPSMKYVAPVRKALKIRTVFNIMGPLLNPALVSNILLGVYDKTLMRLMIDTLNSLGVKRAMVVYSDKGVDEITLAGTTYVMELYSGSIQEYTIQPREYFGDECILFDQGGVPSEYGYARNIHIDEHALDELLQGKDAKYNAQLIEDLLSGNIKDPLQKKAVEQTVVLNAGAGLYVSGNASSIAGGVSLAYHSIRSGAALRVLENMRRQYHE